MISDLHSWATMLDDYFGVRLTAQKQQRWQELLRQSVNTGNSELMDVIPWVANQRRPTQYTPKPTIEQLAIWVKWYRKEQAAGRRGYSPDTSEGRIARVKSRMRAADGWMDRWNLLCGGNRYPLGEEPEDMPKEQRRESRTLEECQELEAWAREQWPDWDERIAEVKQQILANHPIEAPGTPENHAGGFK